MFSSSLRPEPTGRSGLSDRVNDVMGDENDGEAAAAAPAVAASAEGGSASDDGGVA